MLYCPFRVRVRSWSGLPSCWINLHVSVWCRKHLKETFLDMRRTYKHRIANLFSLLFPKCLAKPLFEAAQMRVFSVHRALCETMQTVRQSFPHRWVIKYWSRQDAARSRFCQRERVRQCFHVSVSKVNAPAAASTPVCIWLRLCLRHALFSKHQACRRLFPGCVFLCELCHYNCWLCVTQTVS